MSFLLGGALAGLGGLLGGIFGSGKKIKIPEYRPPDIAAQQRGAIQTNLASMPAIGELTSAINLLNQSQLEQILSGSLPNYKTKLQKASENIDKYLAGELTPDIERLIRRRAAEWGISSGVPNSEIARNLGLRDLGRTALEMQQQWTSSLPGWLGNVRNVIAPQLFNPAAMMLTPQDWLSAASGFAMNQFQRDLYQAQASAMPNPLLASIGQGLSSGLGMLGGYLAMRPLYNSYMNYLSAITPQPIYNAH